MDIKIITDSTSFDLLREQWNDLALRANDYIFQTFEWNRIWWKYFGEGKKLHLILFYENNRLVGIAPLFRDSIDLFGKGMYTCLRFIGSNINQPQGEPLIGLIAYSDYLDLIVEPGYEETVARRFVQVLEDESLSCDEILLEEVPEQSMIHSHLVPIIEGNHHSLVVEDSSSCANILLDESWDGYLAKLNGKDRNKTRKYLKKLEDENEKLFRVETTQDHTQLSDSYETLVDIHQEQWNFKNFPGFFYERRMYEFIKEISHEFFDKGWMYIKELKSLNEEACIGTYLFFKYKKRLYGIIGGMNYKSPLVHEGIGHIALTESLREAIENGYEVFDFIRGLQDYKLRTSDIITTNRTVMLKLSESKNESRINFAKTIIKIQRRLRIERIQLTLSFKNKKFLDGLRNYSSFITERIKEKRASISKNYAS